MRVEPWRLFDSISRVRRFTVTEDHLKLLRHAWVDWDQGEGYGAPGINPKKPYGNSDVERDIAEILEAPDSDWEWVEIEVGFPPPGARERVKDLRPEAAERFTRLHAETAIALQIVLATGEFRPGRYTRTQQWSIDWKRDDSGLSDP